MTKEEIAMQLTLKAIECDCFKKCREMPGANVQEVVSSVNKRTAAEIGNYFNTIYTTIDDSENDFTVQS